MSNEAKHTPRPWTLERDAAGNIYTDHGSDWLFGPDGKPIIHFDKGDYDSEPWVSVSDVDAHLIAAAPDLLESLQEIVAEWGYPNTPKWHRAKEAIAKAIGQSKREA